MLYRKLILVWLICLAFIGLRGITRIVDIEGAGLYTSIQTAINASASGDTVLVYPGRYFENVDYIGKSITVCSLEATTSDTTYVSSTIIDGNHNGSCVAFRNEEQNAVLRGFTITNGSGYPVYADRLHRGGGILAYLGTYVTITNCDITQNYAGTGGGVFSCARSIVLSGLTIHDNYAIGKGGGLLLNGSYNYEASIVFDPIHRCSVYENYAIDPVDIMVIDVRANLEINLDMFTVANPYPFYVNRHNNVPPLYQYYDTMNVLRGFRTEVNHDLYVSPEGNDNNTGFSPDQSMKTITRAIHRIAADSLNVKTVYLLPGTYSDSNGEQILPIPVKSNTNMIGAGSDEVTIYSDAVQSTAYSIIVGTHTSKNNTIRGFKITEGNNANRIAYFANLSQENLHLSDVIIENMSVYEHGAVYIYKLISGVIDSLLVRNITTQESAIQVLEVHDGIIKNSTFENITSTFSSEDTPGDDSWSTTVINTWVKDSLKLDNCTFRNISVMNNQNTFHVSNTFQPDSVINVKINNCLFYNIRTNSGVAIVFDTNESGSYQVSNCSFYNNYGNGEAVGVGGCMQMSNNIFNNLDCTSDVLIYPVNSSGILSTLDFDYNSIRSGIAGISNTDNRNTLIFGENNSSADPMFASTNPLDQDYLHLAQGSPCVNTGTPDTTELDLPPYDLAGNWRVWNGRIDMGCFEYGSEPWVSNDDPVLPLPLNALTAYPNPFKQFTTLRIDLDALTTDNLGKVNEINVDIYNLRGQKIKTIALNPAFRGEQITYWDGRDDNNNPCSNGIYLLSISVNGRIVNSRKVTLVK